MAEYPAIEADPVAASALTAHAAKATAIHGIADTAALVVTTDGRLSDARAPLAHAHVAADVTGLQTTLDAKVETTDARLSNARTPSGAAGGDLAGTYPNPTLRAGVGGGGGGLGAGSFAAPGRYYSPDVAQSTGISAVNVLTFVPFVVEVGGVLDSIGIMPSVSTGEATMIMRLGIYADVNGLPGGAPLVAVNIPSNQPAWSFVTSVISLAVTPGRYWQAFVQNGTGATCGPSGGAFTGEGLYIVPGSLQSKVPRMSNVTGALPTNPTFDWSEINAPIIQLRRAP